MGTVSALAKSRGARISADSHMSEPPDLWESRLPRDLRDYAIHIKHEYGKGFYARAGGYAVSYTHLTLPTRDLV